MNYNLHITTNSSFPPNDWVETTLGEVCEIKNGKTNSQDATEDGEYPLFDRSSVIKKSNKYIFNTNAIIIPGEGAKFIPRYFEGKFDLHQRAYAIYNFRKDMADPVFFFYQITNSSGFFEKIAVGSTVKSLRINHFIEFPVYLPSLPEQRAIASVLSIFDDKIELLREENKILENMGRVIFKEWFGRHEVASELPEGWRVGNLGEEFNITIGRTPPRAESQWFSDIPTGKKWISIKDIGNSGTYIFDTSEYLTDEAINKFNIPVIPENTTILSFKMTVGKLAITTEEMLSNEAIAHFKLKKDSVLSSEYIYSYLQKLDFNVLGSTSSIVTAINSTMIKNLEIIIPNQEILKQFDEAIRPIFRKIRNNSEQIQSLARSRDELLPQLMSGQIRVNS